MLNSTKHSKVSFFELDKLCEKVEDVEETRKQIKFLERLLKYSPEDIEKNIELFLPLISKVLQLAARFGYFKLG
jgi:hypothetical protein